MAKPAQLDVIEHRSAVSLSQYEMYKSKELCDVTLCITDSQTCEETSIECHKLVLSAASQYFRNVLLEGDSSSVNFLDLSKGSVSALEEALNFIYSGKCKVTSENMVELLRYSISWKIIALEQLLKEMFLGFLTIENIVAAYELVTKEGKEDLEREASAFLRENFCSVMNCKQFLQISLSSLCKILKEDEICIKSEDEILKTVLEWLKINPHESSELTHLWSLIKFEHLSGKYLVQELLHHPQMQDEPQKSLVKIAVDSWCNKDNDISSKSLPRYWGVKPVYDKLAKITRDKKIFIYSDDKKEWGHVGEVPDWVDSGTHCCVTKENLVLSGTCGLDIAGKCEVVDINKFMITSILPDCDNKLQVRGIANIGTEIFVIGGRAGTDNSKVSANVDKLSIEQSTNKWESIECLPKAVRCPLVFAYRKFVFVVGGCVEGKRTVFNQMYNIEKAEWLLRSPAPAGCYSWQNGGFIHHNKIHIFTEEHHMTYTIDTDSWTCTQYEEVGFHIQPVLHGDEILACVKCTIIASQESDEFVCKRYDVEKNQWSDMDIDVKDCLYHHLFFTIKLDA